MISTYIFCPYSTSIQLQYFTEGPGQLLLQCARSVRPRFQTSDEDTVIYQIGTTASDTGYNLLY